MARAVARYNVLIQQLSKRVESHPRVAEAGERWSTCMAVTGHTFDEPQEVVALVSRRFAALPNGARGPRLANLQQLELRLARADTRCRRESGVEALAADVTAQYEQDLIDRHPRLISLVYKPQILARR